MEIQQVQQIRKYVDMVVRRRAIIASFILLGVAAGLAYYLSQPKIYEASALLSYQQQAINPARMSPDEHVRIREIVSTLTQIVTSNSSLERIINETGLYTEEKHSSSMDDLIYLMRANVEINPVGGGNTFRITFTGRHPDKVARVTNALSSKFIEENMKYREEKASDTFSYTSNELERTKEILDEKEAVMRDYNLQYFNEMPEQRANNMVRLNSLQQQYQDKQDSIQDLERTRVLIQDQIAVRKQMTEENAELRRALINTNTAATPTVETRAEKIDRLTDELDALLDRYTEKHPEIKRLRKQIANLKQPADTAENEGEPEGAADNSQRFDQDLFDLQIQLKDIGLNIKLLNSEKDELKAIIGKYENWIEAAPVRGAEWSALTREYAELKRHYDFLVSQNLQAGSALNLERNQRGSQFKIEDAARLPQNPVKPIFLMVMALALLGGAGIGAGLALVFEIADSSFRDPAELEDFLNVELICSVPLLALDNEKRKKLIVNVIGYIVFAVCSLLLLAAFVYYYKLGQIAL